jgi:hypothetical protein
MKLQMKDLDIDTYNATFERLAAAAEWEPDAKGRSPVIEPACEKTSTGES